MTVMSLPSVKPHDAVPNEATPSGGLTVIQETKFDVRSREVRMGLVLYGGVSLAIYINGVAQEFFRAVRGRGVYRLVKALTDSDAVVDIISGTSAGGINGIFLAYALCNNKDFPETSNLWREHGDIDLLLRSPHLGPAMSPSLLDSQGYYHEKLRETFEVMGPDHPEPGELRSDFRELDLFVTGTDVDGTVSTQFDASGHPIEVKDHRTIFWLKHREGRKVPFNPGDQPHVTFEALAKLSRITSCFPAAFEPVHVSEDLPGTADHRLQTWGRLGKDSCFLDGGVLDNKPFSSTIQAIFSRNADRDVARKLFYVEPDPERFGHATTASQPNAVQAVLRSLISIPGYESIVGDLREITEHNSRVTQFNRLLNTVQRQDGVTLTAATKPSELQQKLYRQSRLVSLSDRVLQGVFRKDKGRDLLIKPEDRTKARDLVLAFDKFFENQPAAADDLFEKFDVYSRLRRLLRVVYFIRGLLYKETGKELDGDQVKRYKAVWIALNRQIELYQVIQSVMEDLIDETKIDWHTLDVAEIWAIVQAALAQLLEASGEPTGVISQEYAATFVGKGDSELLTGKVLWLDLHEGKLGLLLSKLNDRKDQIKRTIAASFGKTFDKPSDVPNLLRMYEDMERSVVYRLLNDPCDPVRLAYDGFIDLDTHLYPLDMISGLHEKDIIETVRISPVDAQSGFCARSSGKLSGNALYHFGGFFKRSWRANDILWGRLDGLSQLVETLLEHDRLKRVVDDSVWRARIRDLLFRADSASPDRFVFESTMDPAALFPQAGKTTQSLIGEWLRDLFVRDDRRVAAIEGKQFTEMCGLLIEAAQLEVISEELPNVIVDAVHEQSNWGQIQVKAEPKGKPGNESWPPWVWVNVRSFLDPFLTAWIGYDVAKKSIALFADDPTAASPSRTPLGRFFQSCYRVGSEQVAKGIPTLVLLEILGRALLVTLNILLGVFGEKAAVIRRNPLYIFGLRLPIWAFYRTVWLLRRVPSLGTFVVAIYFVCVAAILIGTGLLTGVFAPTVVPNPIGLGVFFALPLVIAILLTWALYAQSAQTTRVTNVVAVYSVCVAAILTGIALLTGVFAPSVIPNPIVWCVFIAPPLVVVGLLTRSLYARSAQATRRL